MLNKNVKANIDFVLKKPVKNFSYEDYKTEIEQIQNLINSFDFVKDVKHDNDTPKD